MAATILALDLGKFNSVPPGQKAWRPDLAKLFGAAPVTPAWTHEPEPSRCCDNLGDVRSLVA